MRIDHIAIYVRDLEASKAYYEKYFGGKSNTQYHNSKTGLKTYFISFEGGCRLEIMAKPDIQAAVTSEVIEYIGYTHLAFSLRDRESVDSLTNLLRDDGYAVFSGPRVTGDGYYESCVSDPDGNRVEIVGDGGPEAGSR